MFYTIRSFMKLKRSLTDEKKEFWQAGKSVAGIRSVEPAGEIVARYEAALGGVERGD